MTSVGGAGTWLLFAAIVFAVLAIDLFLVNRKAGVVSLRSAGTWVAIWVALGIAFNGFVWASFGTQTALQFTQAWLLEYALSIDNVFVFIVIFSYFKVPAAYQRRVLFWGILGAIATRGVFVMGGAALITHFHWVMYLLGAFLVFTSFRLLRHDDDEIDPSTNPVLRLFRRVVPLSDDYDGSRFVTHQNGRLVATPLLAVLVVIEASDVVFAVDSIPACFGVTTDVFVVYTSNIFAILGLRSLFFLVSGLMSALRYLKFGVALILGFVGLKILIAPLWAVPVWLSLGVIVALLGGCTVASLMVPSERQPPQQM